MSTSTTTSPARGNLLLRAIGFAALAGLAIGLYVGIQYVL